MSTLDLNHYFPIFMGYIIKTKNIYPEKNNNPNHCLGKDTLSMLSYIIKYFRNLNTKPKR